MDETLEMTTTRTQSKNAQNVASFTTFLVVVMAAIFVGRLSPTATTSTAALEDVDDPVGTLVEPTDAKTDVVFPAIPVPPPLPAVIEEVAGRSVLGKPIPLIRIGSGPAILIMASIHGNESAGTHLVERLQQLLTETPADFPGDRSVILMPVLNPDGVEAKTRGNAHGVDLNRNFPAENRENSQRYGLTALCEPEALAIYRTVERFQPVRIVTLHEPLRCVDYDGPGLELAAAMAEACPLKVRKLGTRPGSMGAFTGEARQIPTITLELPRDARQLSGDELWERYGAAMRVAVTHPLKPARSASEGSD